MLAGNIVIFNSNKKRFLIVHITPRRRRPPRPARRTAPGEASGGLLEQGNSQFMFLLKSVLIVFVVQLSAHIFIEKSNKIGYKIKIK